MGEVYRAEDTKLGRDVAIKILPEEFTKDPDRLARFEREARVLASLNHANIAAIYEVGQANSVHFLVMELVEGETLADRTEGTRIPVDETLALGLQITEALETAHEQGIIHRDLKPANVKVTPDEQVKVLDFGLAKVLESQSAAVSSPQALSVSPTLTAELTRPGVLLGTAAYMSPEQARGKEADKRTDIWAFGCILYEMLCGRRVFAGDTVTDVLAAIVKSEPDWEDLPVETPVRIRDLLRLCLRKNPRHRLHDIADARLAIEDAQAGKEEYPSLAAAPRAGYRSAMIALGALVVLAVAIAIFSWLRIDSKALPSQAPVRFAIRLPPGQVLRGAPAISPDGSMVAYAAAEPDGPSRVYLRPLDRVEAEALAGTEGGESPFFSADGQWVGFYSGATLQKVALTGGGPLKICNVAPSLNRGATWGPDGSIVFPAGLAAGLSRVEASGGDPSMLTQPNVEKGEVGHWFPQFLPDGDSVLFSVWSAGGSSTSDHSIATGKSRQIAEMGWGTQYLTSGHLAYLEGPTLVTAPFDLSRVVVKGQGIPMLEGVASFAVSKTGSLLYQETSVSESMLVWVNQSGEVEPIQTELGMYSQLRLDPDGQRLAFSRQIGRASDIWVLDLGRDARTRLTFEGTINNAPVWTPDGTHIVFNSVRARPGIYRRSADGSGEAELLLARSVGPQVPESISPEGRMLAFVELNPETQRDIWMLPLDGEGSAFPFLDSPFSEQSPRISPDGRWLAYVSDETGRNEVYLRSVPDRSAKQPISTSGGYSPVWSSEGTRIFYRHEREMVAARIDPATGLRLGAPTVLFEGDYDTHNLGANYDIAGERFVMIRSAVDQSSAPELQVIVNWLTDVKRAHNTR